MTEEKSRESSQDLLNYSYALAALHSSFPENPYKLQDAAGEISAEIKRRVTPPKTPDKGGD